MGINLNLPLIKTNKINFVVGTYTPKVKTISNDLSIK